MVKWQCLHECHKDIEKGKKGGEKQKKKQGKGGGGDFHLTKLRALL